MCAATDAFTEALKKLLNARWVAVHRLAITVIYDAKTLNLCHIHRRTHTRTQRIHTEMLESIFVIKFTKCLLNSDREASARRNKNQKHTHIHRPDQTRINMQASKQANRQPTKQPKRTAQILLLEHDY